MNWQGIKTEQIKMGDVIHINVESQKYNQDKRYQREFRFHNLPKT